MGLLLGVLAEAKSHYDKEKHAWINFCNMSQYVYMDIGFERGVPLGRVVIKLDNSYNKSLTELFIALSRGEYIHPSYGKMLEYTNTKLHYISNAKNLIMGGDVLFSNGSGGCAPVATQVWSESASINSNVTNTRGKVVLLPLDSDPSLFTSIFYVLLDNSRPTIVDGCVIGDVIEGIEILDGIVREYGTSHGFPKKTLIIHKCGHL